MSSLPLIETHCHLDYLKSAPLEELKRLALAQNIEKIVTISVEPENLETVVELVNNHEMIYGTQGIHPHEAKLCTDETLEIIKKNLRNNDKLLAVGEIGLDYHYDNSPRDVQKKVFEQHLQLAIDLDLPVVIHTRDADEDTMSILKNFSSQIKKKGVLHSYTSGDKLAKYALSEGFFLGFNGIITFKKAENVRDILAITPVEQILFETDAPFLTPVPHRGKENAPHYLPFVAQKICDIKNVNESELFPLVYQNSKKLFNL